MERTPMTSQRKRVKVRQEGTQTLFGFQGFSEELKDAQVEAGETSERKDQQGEEMGCLRRGIGRIFSQIQLAGGMIGLINQILEDYIVGTS